MPEPSWQSKRWSPGVLSFKQVCELIDSQVLKGVVDANKPTCNDPSAIDLRLSGDAYLLKRGSVKPCGNQFLLELDQGKLIEPIQSDAEGIFTLQRGKTYLFKTVESLYPAQLSTGPFYGQATAKSSVGRVDVLARLIVDGMDCYEQFDPRKIANSTGEMFIEVTPLSFPVKIKIGKALSQLRFFLGPPAASRVKGRHERAAVIRGSIGGRPTLSVDLSEAKVGNDKACALTAKLFEQAPPPIPLWKLPEGAKPKPQEYWELAPADNDGRFPISPPRFYILRSKELISVPKGIAVYCRAIDETIGELRIHYAGFVHPWFGQNRQDGKPGAPLIFEVRGHNVPVSLRDKEILARLELYRMSEDADPPTDAEYDNQDLTLSKFFEKWPT